MRAEPSSRLNCHCNCTDGRQACHLAVSDLTDRVTRSYVVRSPDQRRKSDPCHAASGMIRLQRRTTQFVDRRQCAEAEAGLGLRLHSDRPPMIGRTRIASDCRCDQRACESPIDDIEQIKCRLELRCDPVSVRTSIELRSRHIAERTTGKYILVRAAINALHRLRWLYEYLPSVD